MAEPDSRSSRRWLAAGAVLVAVVAAAAIFLARPRPPAPQPAPPAPVQATPPAPSLPEPLAPLDRPALIARAAEVADAYAAGRPAPKHADDSLVGRRFVIRLAFGCHGPADGPSGEVGRWRYDPKRQALRVVAQRQDWSDIAWARELAEPKAVEAVEGFWLPRPWTAAEGCPPPRPAPTPSPAETAPAVAAPETLGLAEFFAPGSSRLERRAARPYEFVQKVEADPGTGSRPYDLVIAGRVSGYEDGVAVRCHAASPEQRPVCLIAVEFEKISLEDPRTGETLASWRS